MNIYLENYLKSFLMKNSKVIIKKFKRRDRDSNPGGHLSSGLAGHRRTRLGHLDIHKELYYTMFFITFKDFCKIVFLTACNWMDIPHKDRLSSPVTPPR